MSLGVALLGVTKEPMNKTLPPIQEDEENGMLYPTGSWLVVTKEAAKRYFGEVVTEEEIEESDRILVEQDFIEYLDSQFKDMAEDEEAEDG